MCSPAALSLVLVLTILVNGFPVLGYPFPCPDYNPEAGPVVSVNHMNDHCHSIPIADLTNALELTQLRDQIKTNALEIAKLRQEVDLQLHMISKLQERFISEWDVHTDLTTKLNTQVPQNQQSEKKSWKWSDKINSDSPYTYADKAFGYFILGSIVFLVTAFWTLFFRYK
jgi:TolA-binding protein